LGIILLENAICHTVAGDEGQISGAAGRALPLVQRPKLRAAQKGGSHAPSTRP
jgi:hypothetical protein